MRKTGQISLYDVMAALFVFILVFVTMRGIWIGNVISAEDTQGNSEIRLKAAQAVNSIIKIRGFPKDWDSENVQLIGLAKRANVLSEEKLAEFAAMEYGQARDLLLLGNYDFNLSIEAFDQANNLSIGMPLDGNSTIVSLNRTVKYKEAEASVVFKVFKE